MKCAVHLPRHPLVYQQTGSMRIKGNFASAHTTCFLRSRQVALDPLLQGTYVKLRTALGLPSIARRWSDLILSTRWWQSQVRRVSARLVLPVELQRGLLPSGVCHGRHGLPAGVRAKVPWVSTIACFIRDELGSAKSIGLDWKPPENKQPKVPQNNHDVIVFVSGTRAIAR